MEKERKEGKRRNEDKIRKEGGRKKGRKTRRKQERKVTEVGKEGKKLTIGIYVHMYLQEKVAGEARGLYEGRKEQKKYEGRNYTHTFFACT
jgi:hypothetical protein